MRRTLIVCCVLCFVALGRSSSAQTPEPAGPNIFIVNSRGAIRPSFAPGERFVVLGSGFQAGVRVSVAYTQGKTTPLPATTTTSTGTFRANGRVPNGSRAGRATITAKAGGRVATASFAVRAVSLPPGSIPTHDREVLRYAIAGLVLLTIGSGLIALASRRRRAAQAAASESLE